MKRTISTSTTTTTTASSSSASTTTTSPCLECRSRPARAFLPCGHISLCLQCGDHLLTTVSSCPACQLRFVDFIVVPAQDPSKLVELINTAAAAAANTKKDNRDSPPPPPALKAGDSSSSTTSSTSSPADVPAHEQLLQSPAFAQARDLYAKGMELLGDGASACTTPVLEKPHLPVEVPTTKAAEAFKVFVQSAGLGFPFSQFMVAIMLQNGVGCTANEELALKWLKKASAGDLALAQVQLAQMYSSGKGVYKDLAKMVKHYRKAAVTERAFALVSYGYCLLFGHGTDHDFEGAREVLLAACNAGDRAKAHFYLALIYFNGLGVPVSPKNGFEHFLLAAGEGDAPAQHWVSRCYASGTGTKESQAEAAKWAMKAAEKGHAGAQHSIGCRYMCGNSVTEDQALGMMWIEKSADQNYVGAVISLSFYFAHGLGTDKSEEDTEVCAAMAKELLEQPIHKLEMGECLEWGEGSDRNVESAKAWYRQASVSSQYAEFALIRHGEAGKKKKSKKAELAESSTSNTSLTMVRPRAKSASGNSARPDISKLQPATSAAPVTDAAAHTLTSTSAVSVPVASAAASVATTTSAKPEKEKKSSKLRRMSAGSSSNLNPLTSKTSDEGADATGEKKKKKIISIQFKRHASSEAIKKDDAGGSGKDGSKKSRFVPLEVTTSTPAVVSH